MPVYHVKCYETVNFTVSIEAETEDEARELAHADINSQEVVAESTTEWDIEEVILESEEWYNKQGGRLNCSYSVRDNIQFVLGATLTFKLFSKL